MSKDKFSTRDGLKATISVPDGEEHLVVGMQADDDSPPTEPRPKDIVIEVVETSKGWGLYVEGQHAPLTAANVTWHTSAEKAATAVTKIHEDFGWRWNGPVSDDRSEEQDDPNRPGKTRTVRVKGKNLISPGNWASDYHLLFDPATHAELMEAAK